ncbi:MAG: SurA N-terminal domain-containing protein [Proteobacteria bacterium]|nr:SurA N-terminal domain-containing protein [Pseudomonadota bacterium]
MIILRKPARALGPCIVMAVAAFLFLAPGAGAEVVDRIVAVVNNEVITLSDLNKLYEPVRAEVGKSGYPPEAEEKMLYSIREEILNKMVENKLSDQEIERLGITISNEQVDTAIEGMKSSQRITDDDLRGMLLADGITMEEYRKSIREQLLRSRLMNRQVSSGVVVTEEDVKEYYDSHAEEFGGKREVHLRQILRRVPEDASRTEKERIRKNVEEARKLLEKGHAFEEVERSHSDIPGRGDPGFFRVEQLAPELVSALPGMKPGDFSPVLENENGYLVFDLVEERETKPTPLEEVRGKIEQKLYNQVVDQKYEKWLSSMKESAYIKIIR